MRFNRRKNKLRVSAFERYLKCIVLLTGFTGMLSTAVHAGQWQNGVSIGGFSNVNIYTPDTTSSIGNGKALMLVLHGCVQPINNFSTANLEDAADQYGMVIAVPDAVNKAGFSCWSYWQGTKSRSSGDYANLINLANTMSADTQRNIDPDQVYIAGLSSGASFANTTACLAPDVFAGMGISAGPSIGTSSNGALGPCETANVNQRCNQYAGTYGSHFATQIASIAHGDADTTVNTCYNRQNAEGMADVYGVSELPGTSIITEGSLTADETLWQDNRVSMLWLNNVDHAWSGGAGASGGYISNQSVNYATYLGGYFEANNQRVNRNEKPVVNSILLSTGGSVINIDGNATDIDGSVASVQADISDISNSNNMTTVPGTVNNTGDFITLSSGSLSDGLYLVSVTAVDDQGLSSDTVSDTVRIGPPPPPTAPVLSNVSVAVNGQCATVTGNVFDENQNLDVVSVVFDNGSQIATVNGSSFSAEACNLSGGNNTATVNAVDTGNLSSSATVNFVIDAGQTATLDQHISAGRLDYGNYANCYLEYSTAAFKLNEFTVGGQCEWRDDDASCVGPLVTCDGTPPPPPPPPSGCEEFTQANYYHKTAGRAYSTGSFFSPDYFAEGTNEAMSGSTWGNTTLYSTDGTNWSIGSCP